MFNKILVLVFLGLLVNILNAQLIIKNSSDTELMRVTNTGLVGIGTNTMRPFATILIPTQTAKTSPAS
jgi:hypothetical protein